MITWHARVYNLRKYRPTAAYCINWVSPEHAGALPPTRGLAIGDVMAALPNHSLGEDKVQLAVDQLTCCIKVTGVGGGLHHDLEHDLAEAAEPPGAGEIGPTRPYCFKGSTGDNPIWI